MKPGSVIRSVFELTTAEARGVAVLLPVLLLVTFSGRIYNNYFRSTPFIIADTVADRLLVHAPPDRAFHELKPFDPNKATITELMELGMDSPLAVRLDRYRKGGAIFKNPSDLMRLYGMDTGLFRRLKPWVVIESTPEKSENKRKIIKPKIEYDLNKSDTADLESAPGIGKKLAARIIKYRTALGGFINVNQLYEIFGMDSLTVFAMDEFYVRPDAVPGQINLNLATLEQLETHPYLSRLQARAILLYRYQHGPFKSEIDLKRVKLMDTVTIRKIKPYILLTSP
jgi:competence protein ComEA